MFNLSTASQGIRKAAAMQGIRSGQWESVFDHETEGYEAKVAKVTNGKKTVVLTSGDVAYADSRTWEEINR